MGKRSVSDSIKMNEEEVSVCLQRYFSEAGLKHECQYNIFDHDTDSEERSFRIDVAFKPFATKGSRTPNQQSYDLEIFRRVDQRLEEALQRLDGVCAFPTAFDLANGWHMQSNPNPMARLAVEIENSCNKYFLGSLLAASIAGNWGILVIPEGRVSDLWVSTVRRMIHKGSRSPIPSNIRIFK